MQPEFHTEIYCLAAAGPAFDNRLRDIGHLLVFVLQRGNYMRVFQAIVIAVLSAVSPAAADPLWRTDPSAAYAEAHYRIDAERGRLGTV